MPGLYILASSSNTLKQKKMPTNGGFHVLRFLFPYNEKTSSLRSLGILGLFRRQDFRCIFSVSGNP